MSQAQPEAHLHRFGLQSFRPGQQAVIESVFAGRDCLCIMPTGGGKSLCYQLPSVGRPGVTIVVSPLIALMKDQVDGLLKREISATFINSSMTLSEQNSRMAEMTAGRFDLVYVAPERLRNEKFMEAIASVQVQMLAIDEAHCISQWGHDFRPDYQRLGRFRQRLGNPQTIALTATATQIVQEDIAKCLQLNDPAIFVTGFSRDNLSLFVESPYGSGAKDRRLLEFLEKTPGCGIVYAATRKNCEKISELLKENLKRPVALYHGGLDSNERRHIQDQFMSGAVPIIIATNAFGMGVDKADLRFVVHYQLPGSLEAYYQEVGRAGRDGKQSKCLLLFSHQDRFIQEFFIENAYPSRETVKQVYEFLRQQDADPIELTLLEVKEALQTSVGTEGIATCQRLLEQAGVIERMDTRQNLASVRIDSNQESFQNAVGRDSKNKRKVLAAIESIVGDRRFERVYFNMSTLVDRSGLKQDAVNRSLRELSSLNFLDYVPPFRGRAVHFRRRDLKFSELVIDFEELDRRRKAEYDRLDLVMSYCRSNRCRQLEILEYFGDSDRRRCGKCDNCRGVSWEQVFFDDSPELLTDATVASGAKDASKRDSCMTDAFLTTVQIALSGAARTHGRIGKGLLCQMLWGSEAKKLQTLRLHRIRTFGALKWMRQKDVNALVDAMIQARLLDQLELNKFRPTIEISPLGIEVMYGRVVPRELSLPSRLVKQIDKSAPLREPQREMVEPDSDQVTITLVSDVPAYKELLKNQASEPTQVSGDEVKDLVAVDVERLLEPDSVAGKSDFFGQEDQGDSPDEFSEDARSERVFKVESDSSTDSTEDVQDENSASEQRVASSERLVSDSERPVLGNGAGQWKAEVDVTRSGRTVHDPEVQSSDQEEVDFGSDFEPAAMPAYYWTWRMFVEGFSMAETASIRRMNRNEILADLQAASSNGLLVNDSWFR